MSLVSIGEIAKFSARVVGDIVSGRVSRFFGEALRQAGILILGSAIVIWGLAFILGLQSMVLNTVLVHLVGMVGTQIFWGSNPRAPIGG